MQIPHSRHPVRQRPDRFWIMGALVLALCLGTVSTAAADIYVYVDENGVRRFTDKKPAGRHKVFLKTPKPSTLQTSVTFRPRQDFDTIIAAAASTHGVSSELIKSVIQAESAFDTRAISPKGAKGLMQIMPANFKALAIRDPFDPRQNIMGGTRYLKQMLERYDNNMQLALAAYNAGPEAVDRHRRNVPPYDETRAYVKRVIQLYHLYKRSL